MKKIIATGNVGRDPEVRSDQSGNQFVTFSLGVNVGTKQNPRTDWLEVSCGGKLADVAKNYVKKGSKILIEGFPSVNAYLTRDNKPAASLRVNVNILELLSKREDEFTTPTNDYSEDGVFTLPQASMPNINDLKSDDIPF